MSKKRFTITSALLYANGPIHIGHIAGAYLPADIFVRYHRLKGDEVLFICGSDEHGAAITLQAKKEKITPKEIIDKYHELNKKTFSDFGIDFCIYHRTSEALHHETASDFFSKLNNKNAFVKKESNQYYDKENDQFLADRYIVGKCPKCHEDNAYGDQCEKCGATLSPEELIDPKSSLSKKTPIKKKTTHWYLPMQNHEKWIKEWIEDGVLDGQLHHNPKNWKNQVISQCKSWIENGLKERAMTRDLDWGVKVPLVEEAINKVLYVWLDAPIGYVSATKQWALENDKNWEDYWKKDETKLIHFIGKDNIVFHCIIFPIILRLMEDYILPYNVPANEFLNLEGSKLSTSKNWAVWLHEYLENFTNQQDALRYYLCINGPENRDADFSWKDFQNRNNNELVAIFGNFVNRVLVLTQKYWNGEIPKKNNLYVEDMDLLDTCNEIIEDVELQIENYKFRKGVQGVMKLARLGNKYLAESEPWKIKNDEKRKETILYTALQIVAKLSIVSEPFIPFASKKIRQFLNISEFNWNDAKKNILKTGVKINKPELLFSKIEDEKIQTEIDKLKS